MYVHCKHRIILSNEPFNCICFKVKKLDITSLIKLSFSSQLFFHNAINGEVSLTMFDLESIIIIHVANEEMFTKTSKRTKTTPPVN